MSLDQLTPIERRIYDLLSDGEKHLKQDVFACLQNPYTDVGVMRTHLSNLRSKIRSRGLGILTEHLRGSLYYRMIRFISKSD